MDPVPSTLLLDDGELGRVRGVLARLGVEFEHHRDYEGAGGVFRPRQLLVTSATRARFVWELETLDGETCDPIWICAHNQDFLPMRERLRGLGVHYLISSSLEREAMRLFFLQVLHQGVERRRNPRLQVLESVSYRIGAVSGTGRLEEISRRGCRVVTVEPALTGADATVYLPLELSSGKKRSLSGTVTHCSPEVERSGGEGFSVIVVFGDLESESQACVDAILAGRNLGTRITALDPSHEHPGGMPEAAKPRTHRGRAFRRAAARALSSSLRAAVRPSPRGELPGTPPSTASPSLADAKAPATSPAQSVPDAGAAGVEHRGPRRRYPSKLMLLDDDAPHVVLGRDLSMTGIRLAAHPSLSVGAHVSIALYGGSGDEPLRVAAEVVREDAGGFGLNFDPLTPEQQAWLGRVVAQLPQIQSLAEERSSGGWIVSKLVSSET